MSAAAPAFGAWAGVVTSLWLVGRHLKRKIDTDSQLGKIEIHVYLNEVEQ